jgi:Hydrazine synthase alpha subunit middle domain
MPRASINTIALIVALTGPIATDAFGQRQKKVARSAPTRNVELRHISSDHSVKLDYDIVYVRGPRRGDEVGTNWAEVSSPLFMDAGADLMLLHPDGTEEVLVAGGKGSVVDPMVSFDGESVYYSLFHDMEEVTVNDASPAGADIYKIHVKSRRILRLTHQQFTPNTGAGNWSNDFRTPEPGKNFIEYGVFNTGPCPVPGGKVAFTSNRNGFRPPKRLTQTMQLFVMDDDGSNVECIGHLNLGTALHPVVLKDGRLIFSTLESQGLRTSTLWGLWSIHPDGTNWGPVLSAFLPGESPNAFHFQTQLTDGSIVAEEYYNQTSSGFGGFVKLPVLASGVVPKFGPGHMTDPRNPPLRGGLLDSGEPRTRRLPFSPRGVEALTPFARTDEGPADFTAPGQRFGARVGKVTHPSAAPDNHLLTAWSPGPVNGGYTVHVPAVDSGLYLIKAGKPIDGPAQLLLIKNDPRYNEQWPRALVPYRRIYGSNEPIEIARLANDGKRSPSLPAGTPFGLIGTSSLYKRESYPNGVPQRGGVTAAFAGGTDRTGGFKDLDPFNSSEGAVSLNWTNQGADAGRYTNDDIHAVRILVMEPTTDRQRGPKSGRTFRSHATERLRILGEVPVRKFPRAPAPTAGPKDKANGGQPTDPDGNPDTSFLARIPADVAFTFQTLDRDGMVLNMAQTWHQLRPGEVRNDCGGCHAHSQKPTLFRDTAAASPDYQIFDLTERTPLVTTRPKDESGQRWDGDGRAGLRYDRAVMNVEYYRDVKPIFDRSCVACHTQKDEQPAAGLVLDDDKTVDLPNADDVPGTYYRLAMDFAGRFGRPSLIGSWRNPNASRYVRMFQSRRSLLIWKVFGRRTDGWTNDDFPTESVPGGSHTLAHRGKAIADTPANRNRADLDLTGSVMPPPQAVVGDYQGPDGKKIKVAGLSDEDRLTLVRWIDLGCPIDLDFNPDRPEAAGFGWMLDDQRPTLTLTSPRVGANPPLTRILVGMYDYGGLSLDSFQVVASFPIDGVAPGENLAKRLHAHSSGVWELKLQSPLTVVGGVLTVSVQDRQGNLTRIERTFSATKAQTR